MKFKSKYMCTERELKRTDGVKNSIINKLHNSLLQLVQLVPDFGKNKQKKTTN
jgi:hypothetical protein